MHEQVIVPAPHQTDQELAQQLVGLARELGLDSGAIATDTSGPRMAFRVSQDLYDAWLIELGAIPAGDDTGGQESAGAADDSDPAGAGAKGSAAPAASPITTRKTAKAGKAAA